MELERLVNHLLVEAALDVQVEARTKDVASFVDKIERKDEKYASPVEEITDLCGLRVVCYYLEDVGTVGEVIEREFAVDWPNSVRQSAHADPDRFGYRSDHYIVELKAPRNELAEWSIHAGLKAEIQVRTVMQHAWAAVDHKIRYKRDDLPRDLRRRLSRLSALLETADEQFSAVQGERRQLTVDYGESFAGGDFDVELDVLALQQYLRATELDVDWTQRAVDIGYRVKPEFQERFLLEPNEVYDELELSRLLDALREVGTTSFDAVNEFFTSMDDWGEAALREILNASAAAGFTPVAYPDDVLAFLSFYAAGNLAAVDRTNYKPAIQKGLKAAIRAKRESE